ncbi:hypothetical protein KC887_04675 [Candidatus Kaiserbacteria bacterium]|nr:hypothetical protein [Candidatus Kaiserbacteria bacterium]
MAIIKFTHNNKTYTCLLFKGSVALNMRQVCTNVEVTDGKELDYINLKVFHISM